MHRRHRYFGYLDTAVRPQLVSVMAVDFPIALGLGMMGDLRLSPETVRILRLKQLSQFLAVRISARRRIADGGRSVQSSCDRYHARHLRRCAPRELRLLCVARTRPRPRPE